MEPGSLGIWRDGAAVFVWASHDTAGEIGAASASFARAINAAGVDPLIPRQRPSGDSASHPRTEYCLEGSIATNFQTLPSSRARELAPAPPLPSACGKEHHAAGVGTK